MIRAGLSVVVVAVLCAAVSPGAAQAQRGLGFRFGLGWQEPAGELGRVLDGGLDGEASLLVPIGRFRVGGGASWVSFNVEGEKESWNQVRFHGLVAYPMALTPRIRSYVEGRYTHRRLRPEDDRYHGGEDRLLREFSASGSGFEGVAGLEFVIGAGAALDVAGSMGRFSISPDLSEEGLGPIDDGSTWRVQLGLTWFPLDGRR